MALKDLRERYPNSQDFTFGDREALCDLLLEIVRAGAKRATCEALQTFSKKGLPLPVVGEYATARHWDETPALVIQTTEIRILPFQGVGEIFALDEVEDANLEGCRSTHCAHFEKNGGFAPDMDVVCERFRLVDDFG